MSSATRSHTTDREETHGISYHGRTIFKVGGAYFYISTGTCSNLPGMLFPFYGVAKNGWFIKPQGKGIAWGLCSSKLHTVNKVIRDLCSDGTQSDRQNFMARFSNLEQMYTSYKYGHPIWDGPIGKAMEAEFGFDPTKYKSLSAPNHVKFVDDIKTVNKWLRSE